MTGPRGQANVVGVAVMLGVTVVALATLTASIGSVVQDSAATADAARVAEGLDDALRAVEASGHREGKVSFSRGELAVVDRQLRVLDRGGVVATVDVDAVVFRTGDQRVIYLAGAVVRDTGAGGQLYETPPVTASRGTGGVLVVGAPTLNATTQQVVANEPTTVRLETDVSHDRRSLGNGTYRVAVETTTPDAWTRYFERVGATVTDRKDFDGDGTASVVARFPGERVGYLVVHDLALEVRPRG